MFSDERKSYNNVLLDKIESFIKKFYLNKLIQGCLIGSVLLIASFLIINTIEYFSWSSSKIRLILLISLITLFSIVVCFYFVSELNRVKEFVFYLREEFSDKHRRLFVRHFLSETNQVEEWDDEIKTNNDRK